MRRYLVVTGASYSIFPHSSTSVAAEPRLIGQPIRCWGEQRLEVLFGRHCFAWTFLLADVAFPIISIDFLSSFKLTVDPARACL